MLGILDIPVVLGLFVSKVDLIGSSYFQATKAYNKVAEVSKNLKPSNIANDIIDIRGVEKANDLNAVVISPSSNNKDILRKGDVIDKVTKSVVNPSFTEALQGIFASRLKQIRKSEKYFDSVVESENPEDMVKVMGALNEAEVTLQQVIAVRDKFVDAFLKILNMPL